MTVVEPLSAFLITMTEFDLRFPIEGFGGKRALGFLRKSELCQNPSKFRMQFCLGALNNVLHVFSLKLAFYFEILRMQKTCICCHVSM